MNLDFDGEKKKKRKKGKGKKKEGGGAKTLPWVHTKEGTYSTT